MAQRMFARALVLVLVTVMLAKSSAQPNCTPAIVSLSPCLGFITGNSSAPSASCCTQLASVVQSQAQCLCVVINGAPQLPFAVNRTQALTLPGACKIQTPPLSQCNGAAASGPPFPGAGSPQGAPAPASPSTPSAATAPSPASPSVPSGATPATPAKTPSVPSIPSGGSGSKTVPTTGQSSSAIISSTAFAAPLLFFFLFAASAVFNF